MDQKHNIRHTLAHILAAAAKEFDPGVKFGIGPVTDDGFYYDFLFSEGKTPTQEDLKTIEKTMRKLVTKKLPMTGTEITIEEGLKAFEGQAMKVELVNEFASEGKTLSIYTVGEFSDLCKARIL